MKRIILTGASGQVGRHTIAPLIAAGYEVHAFYSSNPIPTTDGVVLHRVNLMNHAETKEIVESIQTDQLIHLAWFLGNNHHHNPSINIQWTMATLNLLEVFHETGGKRAVFAGSVAEYDSEHGNYCTEYVTQTSPEMIYGKCKAALSDLVCACAKHYGISLSWARLFPAYGPYDKPYRLTASVINNILDGADIKVGHCMKYQDAVYVQDLGDGLVALLESDVTGIVNIGTGIPVLLREMVTKIADIMDFKGKIEWGSFDSDYRRPFCVPSITRMMQEVGWHPKVTLEEGLQRSIEWWKQQRQLCLNKDKSILRKAG
ncbi:MAG: NAD(P)-dependent oxidoreductase [Planctomycetaceae bacterium]|jgi:nucleoside-diphosphate-sugar epimerase|nr:NAD(P)-dependent oxidoreductase [Planctomycetaceae bacterium]